jgi:hypothetical protein
MKKPIFYLLYKNERSHWKKYFILNKEKLAWLKTFYENNRLKIVIITISTILFAFLTLDLLSTYLQPRKTEGYSLGILP